VTGGTSQVDETALGKQDDVAAVLHEEAVDLGLDGDNAGSVGLEPSNVDLTVEVANVANNGIVGHNLEVLASQDVGTTSGRDKDLALGSSLGHGENLVTGDGSLEGVDGINLGDQDTGTHGTESHGATLSDVSETGDNGSLSGNHDIGGTLDTVDQGLTASVKVVELGLGNGVVNVDGRNKELALLEHLVQVVDTGGGLLGDTVAVLEELGVLAVDEGSEVTTVIENEVGVVMLKRVSFVIGSGGYGASGYSTLTHVVTRCFLCIRFPSFILLF